jgi:hypothetical protein
MVDLLLRQKQWIAVSDRWPAAKPPQRSVSAFMVHGSYCGFKILSKSLRMYDTGVAATFPHSFEITKKELTEQPLRNTGERIIWIESLGK